MGYFDNKRGKNGPMPATVIMVSIRGPAVIHRISFTPLTVWSRSAIDWMSDVPRRGGAPSGTVPSVHLASNSVA